MMKYTKYLAVLAIAVAVFAILYERIELQLLLIGIIFVTGFIWLLLYLSEDLGK